MPSRERATKELESAIGYIDNQHQAGRMNYVEAKLRHYPTATRMTEAAAKTNGGRPDEARGRSLHRSVEARQ